MKITEYQLETKENKTEYLIGEFIKKMKRDRRIPTAKAIEKDYRFPRYIEFRKVFGNKRIRKIDVLKESIRKFKILFEIEKSLCEDCLYDKETCDEKIESCKNKASLYFKHYEKI